MIVDDRLETVLRTPAAGAGASKIRFRQLVDLLGRLPDPEWGDQHRAALIALDGFAEALSDQDRARIVETSTIRSAQLVRHLAGAEPRVASAAVAAARLEDEAWLALIPELPIRARGFLRHRRDLGGEVAALLQRFGIGDFALPLPEGYEARVDAVAAPVAEREPLPTATITPLPPRPEPARVDAGKIDERGIGAIVRRIEAFRRARTAPEHSGDPRLPFADEPALPAHRLREIQFRTDADGQVAWADGPVQALLWGALPFATESEAPLRCDAETARAVRARTPIRLGRLEIEGAESIAGAWRIDAIPLFADRGGRFTGYLGRLRRPEVEPVSEEAAATDRLRQLLHELRTPVNAIQGFAELIQQQIFGPTPHEYRSLAASIASDAARILGGFEDIDRLIGAENGTRRPDEGETDLAEVLALLVARLEPVIGPREVRLAIERPDGAVTVALDPSEVERLLWRVLAVIGSAAQPGEHLRLVLASGPELHALTITLPTSLAARSDDELFAPDGRRTALQGAAGMLGNGFALRLAAAEARAAGGSLERQNGDIVLKLPGLTQPFGKHTPANGDAAQGAARSS